MMQEHKVLLKGCSSLICWAILNMNQWLGLDVLEKWKIDEHGQTFLSVHSEAFLSATMFGKVSSTIIFEG